MKIVYYAKHRNTGSDRTEHHIAKALVELGHEVVCVEQDRSLTETGDMLLYHKGGHDIFSVLEKWRGGCRVCWWFDKVLFNSRESHVKKLLDTCDHLFITDGSWARYYKNNPKVRVLHQGIGDEGAYTPKKLTNNRGIRIAFTGSIYGERQLWLSKLKHRYKGIFCAYSDTFNTDLYDLCATIEVFVAPRYPAEDFYWSSRVYMTLGSGGFLIHPRVAGIEEEYTDGKHLVLYNDEEDMYRKIDYYLAHPDERHKIRLAGMKLTHEKYTYKKRVEELLRYVKAG